MNSRHSGGSACLVPGFFLALLLCFFLPTGVRAAACGDPPPSLLGLWRGEENAADTLGLNNGLLLNGAGYTNGVRGSAFKFDGGDDVLSIPHSEAWNFGTNDFTIQLWVNFLQIKKSMFLYHKDGTTNGGWEFGFDNPGNTLFFNYASGSQAIGRSWGGTPGQNSWYHVAVTRSNQTYRLYVDGALRGSPQNDTNAVSPVTGDLSAADWNYSQNQKLVGLLDEIAIFNRALTTMEISALRQGYPVELLQPVCFAGAPATNVVAATYSHTFNILTANAQSYQWLKNGSPILGSATNALTLTNVQPADAGSYTVLMSNLYGMATSAPVTLTVVQPLSVATYAGTFYGFGTNDGPAPLAAFGYPYGLARDPSGNLFVSDHFYAQVRKISPDGYVSTFAGVNYESGTNDGPGLQARFTEPFGLACDGAGNVFVADRSAYTIRKISPAGFVTTLAGLASFSGNDDGVGSAARFVAPRCLATDAAGNVYVGDDNSIRRVTPAGEVTTLLSTDVWQPQSIALDAAGNIYYADANFVLRKLGTNGALTIIAGQVGLSGLSDGLGADARLGYMAGLAFDLAGNLLVTDYLFKVLRRITPAGLVTTLAGTYGNTDDGVGAAVGFGNPGGLALDSQGRIYVADYNFNNIRRADFGVVIGHEPISQAVAPGSNVTLNVTAAGVEPLAYQWRFNGVPLAGATSDVFSLSDAQPVHAGQYTVIVSNALGSVTSAPALLTVLVPPNISYHPRAQSILAGNNLILGAAVTGTPLDYQWYFNGTAVTGQTNALLFLPAVTTNTSGSYTLVVTNALGAVTSAPAGVVVSPLPPVRAVVGWGGNGSGQITVPVAAQSGVIAISAKADYSMALKDDGTVVAWGNNSFGQATVPTGLSNVAAVAAGGYFSLALKLDGTVVAWGQNGNGETNLPVAARNGVVQVSAGDGHGLVLKGDGTVVAWGKNDYNQALVPPGLNQILAVAAVGNNSLVLRSDGSVVAWGMNNRGQTEVPASASNVVALAGTDAHSLALRSDGTVVAWGQQFVSVSWVPASIVVPSGLSGLASIASGRSHDMGLRGDGTILAWGVNNGEAQSNTNLPTGLRGGQAIAAGAGHSLTLLSGPPVIRTQPQSLVRTNGTNALFTVDAVGPGPFGFQWRWNGATIVGATNASLIVSNVGFLNEGTYVVVISNSLGSITSQVAVLDFQAPPEFTALPQSLTAAGTYLANFSVAALGVEAYQWRKDGADIPGATGANYSITNLQFAHAGSYTVVLSNLYGSVTSAPAVLTVEAPRTIITLAGTVGTAGTNDGPGASAGFYTPLGVAVDSFGNVFVADRDNHLIRKITPGGTVSTFAGMNRSSGSADGALGVAKFNQPSGVAVDSSNRVYVADFGNNRIRRITAAGVVSTLPGVFNTPSGLAVDSAGNVYVATFYNGSIGRITAAGVPGTLATGFSQPSGVAVDAAGNVFVADVGDSTVRKVTPGGSVSLFAGQPGQPGTLDGLGAAAQFGGPYGIAADGQGNLYVGEYAYHGMRKITPAGLVTTIAGAENYFGNGTADGAGYGARFNYPAGMAVDAAGALYVADSANHTVRKGVIGPAISVQPPSLAVLAGSNVTLAVTAVGLAPLAYQWRFNGAPIVGATNAVLALPNFQFSASGGYTVVVTDPLGVVTSAVAVVVIPRLQVTQLGRGTVTIDPVLTNYLPGQSVTLTATPARWYRFVSWSDGDTNETRSYTIGLTNVLTAIFMNTVPLELRILPEWEQTFGGSADEEGSVVKQTSDGGYIVGGWSQSTNSGTHNLPNYGDADWWLIKLDAAGNKVFERSFGAAGNDQLKNIVETGDGYVLVGFASLGISAGKTNLGFGGQDYWLVKVDLAGQKVWERVYGGSLDDSAVALTTTADGGFVLGGNSSASGGNREATHLGGFDAWLVRTDAEGIKLGSDVSAREANSTITLIAPMLDGGYRLVGFTDQDDSGNYAGSFNYWMATTDAQGVVQTNYGYGSSGYDVMLGQGARVLPDGSVIISGYSDSSPISGGQDVFVLAIDPSGFWNNLVKFGTPGSDNGIIEPNRFGGYLLAANYGASGGTRVAPEYGSGDAALIKLTTNLVRTLEVSFGGTNFDAFYDLRQTADGGFIAVGSTASPPGGTRRTPHYGGSDLWVMKFAELETPIGTPVVLVNGLLGSDRTNVFNLQTPVSVTMTSTWNGPIHFTTDGSEPDFNSPQYDPQNPPQVVPPATVKAIAYLDDLYLASELYVDYSEVVSTRLEFVPLYTVAVSTPGGGTVAVSPAAASYSSNTVVTLTATNLPGWTFLGWQGDVTGTNSVEAVTVNSNITAQAVFGTTLTTNTTGLGSIARTPALALYPYGSTVRLTALPGAARYLAFWTGALSGAISPQELIITNANPAVGATFGTITGTNFGLVVQITGEGAVSYMPATNRFGSNSVVTLTATPKPGAVFTGWSGSSNSEVNPLSLTMNTNKTVTANFAPAEAPQITEQPLSQAVGESNSATLNVVASGVPTPAYQWMFQAAALPGATNASLPLPSVTIGDAGGYWCIVTNASGAATSTVAVLTVLTNGVNGAGRDWQLVTNAAPWSGRAAMGLVEFRNKLWLLGGGTDTNATNDVWFTSDGVQWTLATSNAGWPARLGHRTLVFNDELWILGGASQNGGAHTSYYDTWRSTNGVDWVQAAASAPWCYNQFSAVSFQGQMFAFGGYCGGPRSEIWASADGTNWAQVPASASWSSRYGMSATVFSNRLWVAGGAGISGPYFRDVWSSADGTNWTQHTSTAAWPGRAHAGFVSLHDALWIYGGAVPGGNLNDVWFSADGINWAAAGVAPWSARYVQPGGVAFNNRLWIMGDAEYAGVGGWPTTNDVWCSPGNLTVSSLAAPAVSLDSPTNSAAFTAPASIALSAGATDSDGTVTNVSFFAGTNRIGTVTNAPFSFAWSGVDAGSYSLTAVATDNSGLSATSSPPVGITVNAPNQLPLISISSPTNGSIFPVGTNITVTANAADPDGSVMLVEFFAGTNLIGTDEVASYGITWSNMAAGAYTLTARATDNLGAQAVSAAINIVVTTVATNPPVFSWSNALVEVGEGPNASITVHVFKSADSAQIPADIGFHAQSASADTADFTPPGFSLLSFGVGETVKPITIPITDDTLVESNHFFFLVLDLIAGSISGAAEARITILDDDVPGTNSLFTRIAPNALPSPLATLRVDLAPTNVGQWRFVWENSWRDGGASISGLPPGNYELQFKPVSGYVEPLATYVAVITNTLNAYSFVYSNTTAPQLGTLVVNINPAFVATNGNPNERGQWRRVGEALWHDSGETVDALPAGSHVIEFKLLTAGSWQTPSAQEVTVLPNQLNAALGEYFVANPTPGTGPTPLSFGSQVQSGLGFQRGYQFVGQLLTPLGWGSGTVVKQRVVLTAAHVVFDDYALAFVPNDAVKWFFQRQAGEYEPAPQTPRGFVVSSGYAAQRQSEASPGLSGTASRDLDIAALYFGEAAGRGGFSGYLVSKPGEEWLQIATLASLAGYPVEGIPAQDRGRMHRTEDQAVSWSAVSNQVYATTGLKSYPGNSGGPILVQVNTIIPVDARANYWPAAVYLGGSGNTIVRAIDSLAVGLINAAEVLGNTGGNNTGGEPPRRATDCPTCSPLIYGVLEVSLNPTNIGALGGGYRFKNATNGVIYREPFNRFFVLGNVPWTIEFLPAPYTIAPTNRTLTTTAGHTNKTTGLYKQWGQLTFDGANLRALGSSGAVYRIDFKPTLTTNVWTPVRTQTLTGAGVTLTNLVPGASNGFFRAVLVP